MNIGVAGLGLIGGSMAKAFKTHTYNKVYGFDIDGEVVQEALIKNILDKELDEKTIGECDILIVALYPEAAIEYVKNNAEKINKNAIVLDCCGVKRLVCNELEPVADEYGFTFIGAHPMAGLHMSGFAYSSEDMFKNSSLVLCPNKKTDDMKIYFLKGLFAEIGFTNIQFSTPEEHDRIIAFTSQLCHVVSNAYVKNEAAMLHRGFSAGSYRDLTRVAKLNENMWTELFLENKDYLEEELDELIGNLVKYKDAIAKGDAQALCSLLRAGRIRKEMIDGGTYKN